MHLNFSHARAGFCATSLLLVTVISLTLASLLAQKGEAMVAHHASRFQINLKGCAPMQANLQGCAKSQPQGDLYVTFEAILCMPGQLSVPSN